MVVVTDHDSKVPARRTFRCRAWDLGVALDWAAERAARGGFAGVKVSCDPTGHRWRVLSQLASDRGLPFAALADPGGVLVHRLGALERVQLLLADWREARRRLAETEARMTAVLDELHLSELATSITGLSALGAAAILAETRDVTRFAV